MSNILSIFIGVWFLEAFVDVCIAILQILLGLMGVLIGSGIFMLILFLKGLVILWKTAFPKNISQQQESSLQQKKLSTVDL